MDFLPIHTQHPVASLMDYEDVHGGPNWTDHLRTNRVTFSRGKVLGGKALTDCWTLFS